MTVSQSKPDRVYLPESTDLAALVRMAYALSDVSPEHAREQRFGLLDSETVDQVLAQMKETVGGPVLLRVGRLHGRDVTLTVFRDEKYGGRHFVNPHWLNHSDTRQEDLLAYAGVLPEVVRAARLAPRSDRDPR